MSSAIETSAITIRDIERGSEMREVETLQRTRGEACPPNFAQGQNDHCDSALLFYGQRCCLEDERG